jgi:radical SAM superfamily enzyme YgiQ (UPF0313 family)
LGLKHSVFKGTFVIIKPNKLASPVYLITPPFTQLNTPYPATAYLKGFLNTKDIASYQADLGIEVILRLFSKAGLTDLFAEVLKYSKPLSENSQRIMALREDYIHTIDAVILFLQGKNPTLSHLICQESFLPEASRFDQLEDLDWAFGSMGAQDKAKHLATLYLEDLSDLIVECVDEHFGFSRYAERLARSANSFDELYLALQKEYTYIDKILIALLSEKIVAGAPDIVAISVPFPGNLYASFRIAQWFKKYHPKVKLVMGGGFPNTELRSLSDVRVFEFFDFISLDDGEAPIENLIAYVRGEVGVENFKRTFILQNNQVEYINNTSRRDYNQKEVGTPDYSDLYLDHYISVIEIVNPMHRMWSDGRWNKLTMAHGCYWGKCTFCDISLDYIKVYEPSAAKLLCDRIEALIQQTGQTGFHFVDEAAPPAVMRDLALEILRRKLTGTWWTNIRFEKSFTLDMCLLLKTSGCIAVSGGLEVASDRLLALIQKGVTVEQVAQVTANFTEAGILVHAYLMYGFPTQTIQETIDSLEMVRQLFENGILQSGFWHQFAMTAHSPIGINPENFAVKKESESIGLFANNDIVHTDNTGIDHNRFSYGLKKSLFNFMHGLCFNLPLQNWFEFKIPATRIPRDFIQKALDRAPHVPLKPSSKIVWLGHEPVLIHQTKIKKGKQVESIELKIYARQETSLIPVKSKLGPWLVDSLKSLSVVHDKVKTVQELKTDFEAYMQEDFEPFWYSPVMEKLKTQGLLVI